MEQPTLTKEQEKVSKAIVDFALRNKRGYMAVAGYAGTGKTTVMGVSAARIINSRPDISIGYCAPTGKAASVLGRKLIDFGAMNENSSVHTVHGHIYRLNRKASKGGKMVWDRKSDALPYDMLVVDEASMVTRTMFNDIMSYEVPVVFIGDSGQLPPVNSSIFTPLTRTQHVLTEVHRQALENPIIRWATEIRNGGAIPATTNASFAYMSKRDPRASKIRDSFIQKLPDGDSMILCGMNKTRIALNVMARNALGHSANGTLPGKGERVICLKNVRDREICNGQIFTVRGSGPISANDSCYMLDVGMGGYMVAYSGALHSENGTRLAQSMASESAEIKMCLASSSQDEAYLFDFGYSCSVHKAQGSEWDNVLLYAERNSHMSDDDYRRWLYTGMTRARNKLCIFVS
ncbi:MAG: AAA family ATPase [Desulfovibrio sp.]|nr:AAA family ATPase [Desulfovibrio sp.]